MSNAEYHDSIHWREYISSTQLKHYLVSPKHFKWKYDNQGKEKRDLSSLRFGSLFHFAMECKGKELDFDDMTEVFTPPINPKTEKPYGKDTNKFTEALSELIEKCVENGKELVYADEKQSVKDMVDSLLNNCGETSKIASKFLKWGEEIETSYFLTTESGIKLKVRPDLLTNKGKLIDWKTTALETLDEESIAKTIINYRYDISLAMYQWVLHEITGKWYTPYLVVVSKVTPYDAVIVDMSGWCYEYCENLDMMIPNCGALEFRRLLNLHETCLKDNEWNGAESLIKTETNLRIMKPSIPAWFERKYTDTIETIE